MSVYTKFVEASIHQQMVYLTASRMVAIAAWMAVKLRDPPGDEQAPHIAQGITGMRQELVSAGRPPVMAC